MKIKIPEIVALDIETTGLDPENDRICEISLLRIKEEEIVEKFTTLINPEIKIPEEIYFISGIVNEDVKNSPFFKNVVEKINNFIKGKVVLCHNANFDISFLKKEFERCGFKFPEIKIIDTYLIAKNFFDFESNSLSFLSSFFGIKRICEHRAEDDAKATFEIFKLLLEEMEKDYDGDFIKKVIFNLNEINQQNYDRKSLEEFIKKAILEKRKIMITYVSTNVVSGIKKEITERKILPLEIIEENGVKYLKAFCYLRNEERKFKFDRILEIE